MSKTRKARIFFNSQQIVESSGLSYEQKRKELQKLLAAIPPNFIESRKEVQMALDMIEADAVTEENKPEAAPAKFGYRQRKSIYRQRISEKF